MPDIGTTLADMRQWLTSPDAVKRREAHRRLPKELVYFTKATFGAGAGLGFLAGCYKGASLRALQFLAENAHRLPKTKAGWYFYHREKFYATAAAGIRQGAASAGFFWRLAAGACAAELAWETQVVGREHWSSVYVACLTTMLGYGVYSGLSSRFLWRATLYGLAGATALAGASDAYAYATGESAKYTRCKRAPVLVPRFEGAWARWVAARGQRL